MITKRNVLLVYNALLSLEKSFEYMELFTLYVSFRYFFAHVRYSLFMCIACMLAAEQPPPAPIPTPHPEDTYSDSLNLTIISLEKSAT